MRKIILRDGRHVHPFNEEARDLRIQNKPLWLHQRDVLTAVGARQELEVQRFVDIPASADRLPAGSFTPVTMEANSAVTWYIEDARRQNKPPFDEIKAQVYATYRQVEVQKQMHRLFDDVIGKAGIRYRF